MKAPAPRSRRVWGAIELPGHIYHDLHDLWQEPGRGDEYMGTLVNAWLMRGNRATGARAGEAYVDVGTLGDHRQAIALLASTGSGERPIG